MEWLAAKVVFMGDPPWFGQAFIARAVSMYLCHYAKKSAHQMCILM
jgi:hypothetical protein